MGAFARGSLWTKTFHLDDICSKVCDVHLELQSPFRSAPPKSVLDVKKERAMVWTFWFKIDCMYKNQEMAEYRNNDTMQGCQRQRFKQVTKEENEGRHDSSE